MSRAALVATLLAGTFAFPLAASADKVTLWKGDPQQGVVIEETYAEVNVEIGGIKGASTKYKWDQIKSVAGVVAIEYDDKPSGYDDADRNLTNGDFEKALEGWKKVNAARPRAVFKQHALYKIALCLEAIGKRNDEAVTAYRDLLKEFPASRWLIQAWKGVVNNLMWKGAYSDALKAIADGEGEAKNRRDLPPTFPFELRLLKAQVFEAQKQYPQAEAEFKAVASGAGGQYAELANTAKLGQGRCLVEMKNLDEAERQFKDVTDHSKDSLTLTGAYNGLGDCLLAKANQAKTADAFKKALFAYLHGVTYYSPNLMEGQFEFGKAFFLSGECAKGLYLLEADEAAKGKLRDRARDLYNETAEKFAGSLWADKARAALPTLK